MTREEFSALCQSFTIAEMAVKDLKAARGDSAPLQVLGQFLTDLPGKMLELRAGDEELQEAKAAAKEAEGLADRVDGLLDEVERLQAQRGTCQYYQRDDDSSRWECTECDAEWHFEDDNPFANNVNYCPECGRQVEAITRRVYDPDADDYTKRTTTRAEWNAKNGGGADA